MVRKVGKEAPTRTQQSVLAQLAVLSMAADEGAIS